MRAASDDDTMLDAEWKANPFCAGKVRLLGPCRDAADPLCARVAKADAEPEDIQLTLFDEAEAEQRRRDRRRWKVKLEKLAKDIAEEPERVRAGYNVVADRLETIGLVYLAHKSWSIQLHHDNLVALPTAPPCGPSCSRPPRRLVPRMDPGRPGRK